MLHIAPITLQGKHVRLEPLALDQLDDLCGVGLDEDLWRWTVTRISSRADLERYIRHAVEAERRGEALPFCIREASSGRAIGSSRYASIDVANRRLEIGWSWVGRPWQRTAVNTEAKYLLLRHAFETLGCVRVEFKTDALNERSRNALLRIGAKEEGTLRSHMITESGRSRDSVYFSILDREWPSASRRLEERLAAGP